MDDCISAGVKSASRLVHHTRVLNLSPGTEAVGDDANGGALGPAGRGFVDK